MLFLEGMLIFIADSTIAKVPSGFVPCSFLIISKSFLS
jgi:hypothetical protein